MEEIVWIKELIKREKKGTNELPPPRVFLSTDCARRNLRELSSAGRAVWQDGMESSVCQCRQEEQDEAAGVTLPNL